MKSIMIPSEIFGGKIFRRGLALSLALLSLSTSAAPARPVAEGADKPYVVEYYYKAKWGYADEFIQLYKKNHFPVIKKEKELGRILQVTAAARGFTRRKTGDGIIA
jgi:hypothetical protein